MDTEKSKLSEIDRIDPDELSPKEREALERQVHYDAEEVTTSELRANMAEVMSRVAYGHDRYLVTRNGEPVAAVIPLFMLDKLVEWEDARAGESVREAIEEYKKTGQRTRR